MIELYEGGSQEFICSLDDCISAIVTEELNTSFEMNFTYAVVGENSSEIKIDRVVRCKASPYKSAQYFRIYKISKAIAGMITVYAEHISYAMSSYSVFPNKTYAEIAGSPATLMAHMSECSSINSTYSGYYYINFITDITDLSTYQKWQITEHKTMREAMAYARDLFGGDWLINGNTAKLSNNVGANRNVKISYGNQMTAFEYTQDNTNKFTHLMPFWKGNVNSTSETEGQIETTVYLQNKFYPIYIDVDYSKHFRPYILDISSYYTTKPDEAQIRTACAEWLMYNSEKVGMGDDNFSLSFINLCKTAEYKNSSDTEHIELGDYVTIENSLYGISESERCVKIVYDVLKDRITDVAFGSLSRNITNIINNNNKATEKEEEREEKEEKELTEVPEKIVKVNASTVEFYYKEAKKKITWVANVSDGTASAFKKYTEDYNPDDNEQDANDSI